MHFLYSILIHLLIAGMKILSLFNDKTKKGVEGRRQSEKIVSSLLSKSDQVIWMHASSLGEYEQGLPVLESLKIKFPDHKILITFFSPSGYENVIKKKHIADVICYLPYDTPAAVRDFCSHFTPKLFFTVKYDYWYNLLTELKRQQVKTFVISALFYERQVFFKSYGKWFNKQLKKNINWFFHQTRHSYVIAKNIGLANSSVTGDTRFDRVKQLRQRNNHVDYIEEFTGIHKTIVFGSSWQAEEKILALLSGLKHDVKFIIAPHDLKRVENLKILFPDAVLYSEISKSTFPVSQYQVLIIDSIGLLSKLYSYGDIAVVGGGFHDAGLHNILEAATFGIPVIFGNHYRKNPEADHLIAQNGGKAFENEGSAAEFIISLLKNQELLYEMSQNAENFIQSQPDATNLIIKKIGLL